MPPVCRRVNTSVFLLAMDYSVEVHKAGGILIANKALLTVRSRNQDIFNTPGGKTREGETLKDTLMRELNEELLISVSPKNITIFGTFFALTPSPGNKTFRMDVFMVHKWLGAIQADNEIAELKWVTSKDLATVNLSTVLEQEIVPRLSKRGLIY